MTLAAAQSGYFTAAQALESGYSYPAQKDHANCGNWERVDRGLFRLRKWPIAHHDDLVRWSLWSRGKAVVTHDTALSICDLGDFNPRRVHLTVPCNFRPAASGAIPHRGLLPTADVRSHEGYRITTPLRSLLDVAADSPQPNQLADAIVEAVKRRFTTREELLRRLEEFGAQARFHIERSLLDPSSVRSTSHVESRSKQVAEG